MSSTFTPAQTGFSRVFLIEGRARADHQPTYESCLRAGAPSQTFGDVEKIECPDPNNWGKWIEVGRVKGAVDRATMSLVGRYAADLKSTLLRLARKGCAIDTHINFGLCDQPNIFNKFTKKLILEDVLLTNWEAEDLGALASGDAAKVDETTELSIGEMYEVLPLTFAERAGSVVTNEVKDVVICDSVSCGECQDESAGADKIYAVTVAAGGSPSTPPDIVFSLDKGVNWYAHDIDAFNTAVDAVGVACISAYVVAIATNNTTPMAYATKSAITPINDEVWTAVATGFNSTGTPRAIWSTGSRAFIVGTAGYIYSTQDPTAGVTELDAGVATAQNLVAVHGLDENFVVAVGSNGAIVKCEDGETFSLVTPTNINFIATNFTGVLVRSKTNWLLCTASGRLYYTIDGGVTFYEIGFPGSGSGACYSIKSSTASVLYLSHSTATPRARILRSLDGGYSWYVLPESGSMPAADRFNAVAASPNDANFVVGVGLADNATDGFVVVGNA